MSTFTTVDGYEPKVIATTPRLVLREFLPVDATGLYHLNADPEVLRYTGDEPFTDIAEAHAFILAYRATMYAVHGFGRWSVLRRSDDAFLGWCGLGRREPEGDVDIGFRLSRECWGQGYATEAAEACMEAAFETLGLTRVIARAEPDNGASLRVIAKLGMAPDADEPTTADGMLRFVLPRAAWDAVRATRTRIDQG